VLPYPTKRQDLGRGRVALADLGGRPLPGPPTYLKSYTTVKFLYTARLFEGLSTPSIATAKRKSKSPYTLPLEAHQIILYNRNMKRRDKVHTKFQLFQSFSTNNKEGSTS
jgi:hypothetical protein